MKPRNILIVDDVAINRKLLQAQLAAEDYVVVTAPNGVIALGILEREKVDVIVSDILMPEMDGYRLCYEVRSSERLQQIPFIFYTATYTSPADEKLCMELGADKYLRKPASIDALTQAIAQVGTSTGRRPTASLDGMEVLKQYSERLVSKLEDKNIERAAAIERLTLQTTALETAADAILITDANGTILWVNHAFQTMTGYSRGEAIGSTPRLLKSGRHDAAFYRAFWETLQAGQTWRGEFTNRRKDGSLYHDQHTISPVLDADGRITNFVGVMHDITDRKRAEEELRETHAQLRQLLEHSPAVLYALRLEGARAIPHLTSENVTQLLGFSVTETLSYEWWLSALHPEDRAVATASIAETMAEGVSRTEYRLRHKDGSYRWVEDNRRLVRDAEGTPAELVGVWTDITERRRAQDELRVSERRFSDMLGNLPLVAIMLDRDGRISYCNDYLLRITGWRREELVGRNWLENLTPPELLSEIQGVFDGLMTDSPDASHHENEIMTRSGERRFIRWNNSVLRSGSGAVIGAASIGEDITERRSLERQVLRAQRLESLGTLAGGIAHDLNNLFMPILMGATLIKRFGPSEGTLKAVANIERCVKRGADLVKQVLLLARGAEGSLIPVEIAGVIAEVESIVLSTFPKNVTFATSVSGTLPLLTADPTQLTQVLLNLCVNACDAMPRGGKILVSAETTEVSEQYALARGGSGGGRYVVMEVSDKGTGMSPDVVDRIFEPFFTTKALGHGTGLGLSTTLGIVRSHRGFMTVSSVVGEGTIFKVYMPARFDDPVGTATSPIELPPVQGHGECILVVDDENMILDVTRQALEASGYEVLTARDGAQAIDVYARNHDKVALVLTDMMMPIIDGPTLIGGLRRIDPDVRIIAASGLDESFHNGVEAQYFLMKRY
ncbi:MAG: hypothetical protein A3G75_02525, partial [Verrucomicrobia bacterium RIFCSPLOWO2_12_FULL_64_8]